MEAEPEGEIELVDGEEEKASPRTTDQPSEPGTGRQTAMATDLGVGKGRKEKAPKTMPSGIEEFHGEILAGNTQPPKKRGRPKRQATEPLRRGGSASSDQNEEVNVVPNPLQEGKIQCNMDRYGQIR